MTAAQGSEKAVQDAKQRPQEQPGGKPLGGDDRRRHPKRRFQPPSRGSS